MSRQPIPFWLMILISMCCLILFGFLVGMNSRDIGLNTVLTSDASIALSGAIVGAILGSYGAYHSTKVVEKDNIKKLKLSFYEETEHIQGYLCEYLETIVREHKVRRFDLKVTGTEIHGAPIIDFSVIKFLHLELIKANEIPSKNHRILLNNLENNIVTILRENDVRFTEYPDSVFMINLHKSKYIMNRLCDSIWHINNLLNQKDRFNFPDGEDKEKVITAFKLSGVMTIENEQLIDSVANFYK